MFTKILKIALFFVGLALMTYGCWLIYRPTGFIAGGLIVFGIALMTDKSQKS